MKYHALTFQESIRILRVTKVALLLLGTALIVDVVCLAYGALTGDFAGQLAFSLILSCLFLVIATAITLQTPSSFFRVIRATWLGMSLLVLLVAIALGSKGGDTVLTYAMVILGFPSSLFIAPIFGAWLDDAGGHIGWLVIFWLLLASTGYIQWFFIVGGFLRRRQGAKEEGRSQV